MASPTVVADSDNVYAQSSPPQEEGGLFTRTGRTLDHTQHRVEDTFQHAASKVQHFFTFHSDGDQDSRPAQAAPSNRPD